MVMDFSRYFGSLSDGSFDVFLISVLLCLLVAVFFNVLFTNFWLPHQEQGVSKRTEPQKGDDSESTFEEPLHQKKIKCAQILTPTEGSSSSPKLLPKNIVCSPAAKLKQSEDEGLADVSSSDGSQLSNTKVGRPQSSKSDGLSGKVVRPHTQTPAVKRNSAKKERRAGSANKPQAEASSTSSESPKEALQKTDRRRAPEPVKTVTVPEHAKSEPPDSSSDDWHDVKSKARRPRRQSARSTSHTPSTSVDQIRETSAGMGNSDPSLKQPCELKESLPVAEKPTPPSSDNVVSSELESESAQPAEKPAQVEDEKAESSKEEPTKNVEPVRASDKAPEDDMVAEQSSPQQSKEAAQKAPKSRRKRRTASSKKHTEPVAPDTVEKVTVGTESSNDSENLQEKRTESVHKSSLEDSEFEVIEMPHSSEQSTPNTESDADVSDLGLEQSPKPVAPSSEDLKEFPYLPGAEGVFAGAPSTTLRPMEGGRHPHAGTLLKAALSDSQEGQSNDTTPQGSTPKRSTKRTKARKAD